ncbi:MAG: hypothetical protein V4676_02295 [Bacteroidota bacterium]
MLPALIPFLSMLTSVAAIYYLQHTEAKANHSLEKAVGGEKAKL